LPSNPIADHGLLAYLQAQHDTKAAFGKIIGRHSKTDRFAIKRLAGFEYPVKLFI
jgi:hypothetical protein